MNNFRIKFSIKAVAAAVPDNICLNEDLNIFKEGEKRLSQKTLGIDSRYIEHKGRKASYFALHSARKILKETNVDVDEIRYLVYITQTPDFITPATSIWIQNELGLSKTCLCFDINLGCSGYVNGLFLAATLLNQTGFGKALVLTSDISSSLIQDGDTSTQPIFSDGGSATLIEYNAESPEAVCLFGNDGKGFKAIFKDHPIWGTKDYLKMEGLDILNFTLKVVTANIVDCIALSGLEKSEIDYYILHQAGHLINESIRRRLDIAPEKYLYSLKKYGNTSSSSIPITLLHNAEAFLNPLTQTVLLSGFGVGLSWGSIITQIQNCQLLGIDKV